MESVFRRVYLSVFDHLFNPERGLKPENKPICCLCSGDNFVYPCNYVMELYNLCSMLHGHEYDTTQYENCNKNTCIYIFCYSVFGERTTVQIGTL